MIDTIDQYLHHLNSTIIQCILHSITSQILLRHSISPLLLIMVIDHRADLNRNLIIIGDKN
jgi:hypothetical protein